MSRVQTSERGGLRPEYPIYVAGEALLPKRDLEVVDRYTGEGLCFAMEDMTEILLMVLNRIGR